MKGRESEWNRIKAENINKQYAMELQRKADESYACVCAIFGITPADDDDAAVVRTILLERGIPVPGTGKRHYTYPGHGERSARLSSEAKKIEGANLKKVKGLRKNRNFSSLTANQANRMQRRIPIEIEEEETTKVTHVEVPAIGSAVVRDGVVWINFQDGGSIKVADSRNN